MPDRELRHMRRTELVEIILALKQSEDQLRAENAALSAQLQERQIHIENAGSIAQAALELNKVFEAAQAAADEYVASVLAANKNTDAAASALRAQAEAEAQQILAQAQTEAANLKARTQQQCDAETEAAARKRAQTEADCKAMLARTQQEIQQRRAAFDRRASELLDGYQFKEKEPGKGRRKFDPYKDVTEQQHRIALEAAFTLKDEYGYKELEGALREAYASVGVKLSDHRLRDLITVLKNKRMIVQENGRKYTFKPDFHY